MWHGVAARDNLRELIARRRLPGCQNLGASRTYYTKVCYLRNQPKPRDFAIVQQMIGYLFGMLTYLWPICDRHLAPREPSWLPPPGTHREANLTPRA